jgi:hypothetical protein
MKRLLLSLLVLTPLFARAQAHHEVGLMAGVSNYYGDLQDKVLPSYGYTPMAGIMYKYFMNPHVGLRFGAAYTKLNAADSLSDIPVKQARNLSFGTSLFEVHGGLEINLLPIEVDRMKFSPYIFGGIGLFYYNPYTMNPLNEKVYLRPLSTEGQGLPQYPDRREYSLVNVSFPVGGGLKFFIGKTLMVSTEVGFRYCATDYLDDVSRSYVSLDTLQGFKGKQAADLSFRGDEVPGWDGNYPQYKFQRGDSKANDWYWFGGININIYFDAFGNMKEYLSTKCPNMFRAGRRVRGYNR